jgi:hypothetical protein
LGFAPTTNVRYLPVANYPMPLEPEKPALGSGPLHSDLAGSQAEFDPTAWWTNTLDDFAAWLEGRE